MQPIWIAVVAVLLLAVVAIAVAVSSGRKGTDPADALSIVMTGTAGVFLLVFLILGWMALMPEYRLWRASIEKRIMVEDARAVADSAVELARAEVERAKGTAEANLIVADSITEPYLRYLYVIQLGETSNQVIYLPTEAGLPILEADRFRVGAP